ncbi:MAG: hypothetical protein HYU77_15000 [Betaproteobacteria bacterium]|nr:hypothetical protein [Betaproteobacteria bacterium]
MKVAVWLCLAAWSVAAPVRGESGRLLYFLNCMGCHPIPEGAGGFSPRGIRPAGEFVQRPGGRQFFIRIPPADGRALGAEENARLVEEIVNWKKACPLLLQSAPLIRFHGAVAGK